MIAIGSDHGGYKLKEELKHYFDEMQIQYKDCGTYSEERTDFPKYGAEVARCVQSGEAELGIVICKTGFGMAITANKFKGIRCAAVYEEETARQAKEHLNVNMLAIPAEYVNESQAVAMVRLWLGSEFLKGRYEDRIQMIADIENENMK